MSELLVRGTRTSDSELTTNEMTSLNWTSTFLKMAYTDLQNSRFKFLSSFTVTISLLNGAYPRYKDRGIGYELLQVLIIDAPWRKVHKNGGMYLLEIP